MTLFVRFFDVLRLHYSFTSVIFCSIFPALQLFMFNLPYHNNLLVRFFDIVNIASKYKIALLCVQNDNLEKNRHKSFNIIYAYKFELSILDLFLCENYRCISKLSNV